MGRKSFLRGIYGMEQVRVFLLPFRKVFPIIDRWIWRIKPLTSRLRAPGFKLQPVGRLRDFQEVQEMIIHG